MRHIILAQPPSRCKLQPTQMTGMDSHVFSGKCFCCITTARSTVISGDMDPGLLVCLFKFWA